MKILVLESSTSSAKAMFYDTDGISRVVTEPYGFYDTARQDADTVWAKTLKAGKCVLASETVDMIALSGTYHSVMVCDGEMRPKTAVYQWPFTGASDICAELKKEYAADYYTRTGCMINAVYPSFKLVWMKRNGIPTDGFIMGQGTYNFYRATGKRKIMDSMASGTGLFSIITRDFDEDILQAVGIRREQLSEIVKFTDTSPLCSETAALLGLKSGIPVVPTGPDGGLNQIGAGALGDGIMTFSVGTSGAMRLSTAIPRLSRNRSTWCYRSPDGWMSGGATSGCCNCVDWARSSFLGGQSFADIEKNIPRKPWETPVFLPFIFGERCPGWDDGRKGGFLSIEPDHSGLDMYHAVLEGVLYNLLQCLRELEALNGRPRAVKLSGGIVHSPYWTQMCADIMGLPMDVSCMEQSSMTGAVAEALTIAGEIPGLRAFKTPEERRISPNFEAHEEYMKKYEAYLREYTVYR